MRRALVLVGALLAVLAAPGTASADAVFEPSDADDLAKKLAEAHEEQGVCYGWRVEIDNVGTQQSSVGSNFGAGQRIEDAAEPGDCDTTVEFEADIRWTSEMSESEDSATYQVRSVPDGPTTSDLDSLGIISAEGLAGDNLALDVYKAVSALPLLAANAGVAEPIEASPAPGTAAAAEGGQPTDSPGSDLLRRSGGTIVFASILLLAGVVFAIWAFKTRGSSRRRPAAAAPVGDYMPPEWHTPRNGPVVPPYEPPPAPPPPPQKGESPPDGPTPPKPNPETRPEE